MAELRYQAVKDLQAQQRLTQADTIHITDLESAINHWRALHPCDENAIQSPEVETLAEVYAQMIMYRAMEVEAAHIPQQALDAWMAWYATTRDTPCIAICSTSQGDSQCKGCGRSEREVHEWLSLSPFAKRKVWLRITSEGRALRFHRYAERALLQ